MTLTTTSFSSSTAALGMGHPTASGSFTSFPPEFIHDRASSPYLYAPGLHDGQQHPFPPPGLVSGPPSVTGHGPYGPPDMAANGHGHAMLPLPHREPFYRVDTVSIKIKLNHVISQSYLRKLKKERRARLAHTLASANANTQSDSAPTADKERGTGRVIGKDQEVTNGDLHMRDDEAGKDGKGEDDAEAAAAMNEESEIEKRKQLELEESRALAKGARAVQQYATCLSQFMLGKLRRDEFEGLVTEILDTNVKRHLHNQLVTAILHNASSTLPIAVTPTLSTNPAAAAAELARLHRAALMGPDGHLGDPNDLAAIEAHLDVVPRPRRVRAWILSMSKQQRDKLKNRRAEDEAEEDGVMEINEMVRGWQGRLRVSTAAKRKHAKALGSETTVPFCRSLRHLPLAEQLQSRLDTMAREHGLVEGCDEELGDFMVTAMKSHVSTLLGAALETVRVRKADDAKSELDTEDRPSEKSQLHIANGTQDTAAKPSKPNGNTASQPASPGSSSVSDGNTHVTDVSDALHNTPPRQGSIDQGDADLGPTSVSNRATSTSQAERGSTASASALAGTKPEADRAAATGLATESSSSAEITVPTESASPIVIDLAEMEALLDVHPDVHPHAGPSLFKLRTGLLRFRQEEGERAEESRRRREAGDDFGSGVVDILPQCQVQPAPGSTGIMSSATMPNSQTMTPSQPGGSTAAVMTKLMGQGSPIQGQGQSQGVGLGRERMLVRPGPGGIVPRKRVRDSGGFPVASPPRDGWDSSTKSSSLFGLGSKSRKIASTTAASVTTPATASQLPLSSATPSLSEEEKSLARAERIRVLAQELAARGILKNADRPPLQGPPARPDELVDGGPPGAIAPGMAGLNANTPHDHHWSYVDPAVLLKDILG